MRKLKNILISGILSVCMVVTSLPATLLAQEAEIVQEDNGDDGQENIQDKAQYEIISFAELPESVKNQSVALGTDIEELELPQTLTVSYRSFNEKSDDEKKPGDNTEDEDDEKEPEDDTGDDDGEKELEDSTGDEGGEKEPEDNTGDDDGEKDSEDNTGDEGGEKEPEDNAGDEGGEKELEDNNGSEDSQTPDEKSEAMTAVSGTEDAGKAELAIKEKTVEVHMKEYNSQPENMEVSKELDLDEEAKSEADANKKKDSNADKNEENGRRDTTGTVVIENVTWVSTPAYDGSAEGCYTFIPVLSGNYVLTEGIALPEIIVTVGEAEEADLSEGAEEPISDVVAEPACGTISSDTVWNSSATLSDGELIVEPGVTLTINSVINISGNVTIKGGGTIKRGSGDAYFSVNPSADFTVGEITLEGASISSDYSMIATNNAKLTLDDGCRIQNCNKISYTGAGAGEGGAGGAALYIYQGEAVLNNVIVENCSGPGYGGAIAIRDCVMNVNGGIYRNNKDGGFYAGSVIYNIFSKLYIYGGHFINNTASAELLSGCIFESGGIGSETHLYGGYFEGNKSNSGEFGNGAILFAASHGGSELSEDATFEISGDVQFCGDGIEVSGTDGFFLDFVEFPRKVHIGSPLVSPVYFYLNAQEGYVIAKGSSNGYTLTEKDMKQIHFTDVGDSGKKYYAWLDKEKNEIYLSENVPPYGLYVYYSSNGAKGSVEDNTEYASGEDVTVKSAETLSMEGYIFKEWNTKSDGTGESYIPGTTFKITDDITLYAIFKEVRRLTADFYSGEANNKESITRTLAEGADSVTITTPELNTMEGWVKAGWDTEEERYSGDIAAGSEITLYEDTAFYGIYKKEVELSYDGNGWGTAPVVQNGSIYANVHNSISYKRAQFTVAPAINRAGYSFLGWSPARDSHGSPGFDYYSPGADIAVMNSMTLYAQMVDDIAPVLGDASYNSGYTDIGNWLVRKKDLVMTVPITEEGSGVNKIIYTFTPENGEAVTGEALMEAAYVPRQVRQEAAVQLEAVGGKMTVISGRNITAEEQSGTTGGEVGTTDGEIQARITISEDYKGTVSLKCIDNAGNESVDKLLTAAGGGVIVEDNAPQISFVNKDIKSSKAVVTVSVSDDVDTDNNSKITGGIASITYQIDNKQEQNVTAKNFTEEMVPSCEFNVDISGSGEHALKVTAIDNAGNESQQSTQVTIEAKNKKTTVIKQSSNQSNGNPSPENKNEFVPLVKIDKTEQPRNNEPATGDNSIRVEVYATIAMISGLLYVLLYFITGSNGMTKEEKKETVSHILSWAKKGGRIRRMAAVAAIFCVLFYYHSIGKRVNVEWKETVNLRV